ncbi:MAG: hypothetical protein IKG08_10665 [Eubacterium sp.]|nr:hypothetical protein [Eubacterium sp.]
MFGAYKTADSFWSSIPLPKPGRPSSVYEPSRIWLDEHGLGNVRLYCLNKYERNFFIKNSNSTLELEDYYGMKFDYAVEDSPKAFRYFEHLPELKLLLRG